MDACPECRDGSRWSGGRGLWFGCDHCSRYPVGRGLSDADLAELRQREARARAALGALAEVVVAIRSDQGNPGYAIVSPSMP